MIMLEKRKSESGDEFVPSGENGERMGEMSGHEEEGELDHSMDESHGSGDESSHSNTESESEPEPKSDDENGLIEKDLGL